MSTTDLSIYSIPAAFFIGFFPHAYALSIVRKANNGNWDNANSRGTSWTTQLQNTIPKPILARFERAEAAHKNAIETLPLYLTAVVLGRMARLPPLHMNAFAGAYLLSRVGYNVLYINTVDWKRSFARTFVWLFGVGITLGMIVRAGNVLAGGE